MDLTTQTDYSDITRVSVGGSVQDARTREADWTPDPEDARLRYWLAKCRAGVAEGKAVFADRQALIEQRSARHDQEDK